MLFKENSPDNENLFNFTVDIYNDTSIVKKFNQLSYEIEKNKA